MKSIEQTLALIVMNIRAVALNPGAGFVVVIGAACSVGVLVSMLAMGAGVRKIAMASARPERVIISSSGADGLLDSSLSKDDARFFETLPHVRVDSTRKPISSAVSLALTTARSRGDLSRIYMLLAGVEPAYFTLYPEIKLVKGRMFHSGEREVIVSASQSAKFLGLEVGDHIRLRGIPWTIVGHFQSKASIVAPFITDSSTLMSALEKGNYQYVAVLLDSASNLSFLESALKTGSPTTANVQVRSEPVVMEQRSLPLTGQLNFVSYFVGGVMAVGATLGAMAAMHTVVENRRREIGTLRAIGFGATPIIISVVFEGILLAVLGALIGSLLSWIFINGRHINPLGSSIDFSVSPLLGLLGIIWALAIGLVGALIPAISGMRVRVVDALRAL
jgi:putative ABC transport system permease protein